MPENISGEQHEGGEGAAGRETPSSSGSNSWTPPYMGWANFRNLLDKLETNLPPRIDRTFLTGSNATITITLAGLRSLDLIDAEKRPTATLARLATDADNRKAHLAELLRRVYPEPVALGTTNATQGQLEEAFGKWGILGDTRRKAIAFFLAAAKFADVPISPNFRTPAISRSDGAPVKRGKRKIRMAPPADLGGSTGAAGIATPPSAPEDAMADLKRKFVEALVDKVTSADTLDPDMLDRVQALLGFDTPKAASGKRAAGKTAGAGAAGGSVGGGEE